MTMPVMPLVAACATNFGETKSISSPTAVYPNGGIMLDVSLYLTSQGRVQGHYSRRAIYIYILYINNIIYIHLFAQKSILWACQAWNGVLIHMHSPNVRSALGKLTRILQYEKGRNAGLTCTYIILHYLPLPSRVMVVGLPHI
jgi:hypothetical protein